MLLVCNGTADSEKNLTEICSELAALGVPYSVNSIYLSVRYTGSEPGTARRIEELFSKLCPHTIYYDSR